MRPLLPACSLLLLAAWAAPAADGDAFFETHVRPLLVEKCQSCHGKGKTRGGLRLTARQAILKGGDSGPAAVPGKPAESRLIQAVHYKGDLKMPPTRKLTDPEIRTLTRWVELGLPWPASTAVVSPDGFRITDEQRRWWVFQPPVHITPPAVKNASWPINPIDRFILARLEQEGIQPAPPADRRTFIRRLTFDLTGLPPTPEEVDAFLHDSRPDAYERLVDRLLGSPAYGERWGRHWLDVARYADYYQANPREHGSAAKFELFEAFRYRDWVVRSFNADLPYDSFIVHQLAGDRLPAPDGSPIYPDGLVATTFLAVGVWDHGDADKDKIVTDIVDDQIDTVGKVFLGLTLACARCHDHKFDPFSTRDYYGLAGIFFSTRILDNLGAKGDHSVLLRTPLVSNAYLARRQAQLKRLAELDRLIRQHPVGQIGLTLAARTPLLVLPMIAAQDELTRQKHERDELRRNLLPPPATALAAREGGIPGSKFPAIQDVPIHIRGRYDRLGPVVPRGFPEVLAGAKQPKITSGSGRLELARWIADANHPLTARVLVNRVWQWHFGEGLVRTPSNFGKLGEKPSHPEFLDWLALRFVESGWPIKHLHRLIVLSATYRQASVTTLEYLQRDPDNRWLGRFTARRLEAEAIRDAILAASGELDHTPGGPALAAVDQPRRSLYLQATRWERNAFNDLFDVADPDRSVEKRFASTVAPQALFLLNHPFVRQQAGLLAQRALAQSALVDERIGWLYRRLFVRPPTDEELLLGRAFLKRGGASAWTAYSHALLCSNEFVYLD